jgi:threonine dehydrogenase-like Zn-dependent dehydrogenase
VDHEPINFRERYSDPATMKKTAVGYTLGGTFAEYLLVQEEVIEAGCLVELPAQDLGHYEVSLSEPLSCVVSAQDHHVHLVPDPGTGERKPHKGLLKGGVTVVFGAGVMARFHIELAMTYSPRAIVVMTRSAERFDWLREHVELRAKARGIRLLYEKLDLERLPAIVKRLTCQAFADDIIDTTASPKVVEAAANTLAGKGSVIDTFGGLNIGEHTVPVDLRKVHYDESIITGSSGGNPFDTKRTLDLIHGGHFDVGKQIRKVGSLAHAAGFLQLIKDKKIDGKALIYPHTRLDAPMDTPAGWSRQLEKDHLARHAAGNFGY